ncbi:MAG: hypothetical protein ACRC5T_01945, partial [Cetobacterium sp.]
MGKSGKSTIIKGLTEKNSQYYQVKSYTTREKRVLDLNDEETNVFVDEDFLEENKDRALAIYHSPKGYASWVDVDCFLEDKINLYIIDSVTFNSLLKEVFEVIDGI